MTLETACPPEVELEDGYRLIIKRPWRPIFHDGGQSKIFRVPDRLSFFSPGPPPLHQALEEAKTVIFLMWFLCCSSIILGVPFFTLLYPGEIDWNIIVAWLGFNCVVILSAWAITCYDGLFGGSDATRSPGEDMGSDHVHDQVLG
ncbi:hypothetical protein FPOAC2_12026 [Fusarium poae]|uniref:hypothetical protein n=1 Tax=Fusarium poae TaxID=36050 RepID=UPI001CE82951|nr:hypothetical protein FPOAC1_011710 [Fusarium poae]KAG8666888.1 hypothetical protein FPOAC1_011710 [Fusarium poae]